MWRPHNWFFTRLFYRAQPKILVTFSHSIIYIGLQRRGYIPTLKKWNWSERISELQRKTKFEHRVPAASTTGLQISANIIEVVKLKGEEARAEGGEIIVFDN